MKNTKNNKQHMKDCYTSPVSRYMKFGGDPELLKAPLSNIGMPVLGLFQQGGHVNQWRDELLHAPMSNTGMPVMGLFEHGGQYREDLVRAPLSNTGMPLIGFRNGGCYEDGGMIDEYKKGGWIQKATTNMRTDKPCTGDKFGSESCPPGSKRYNLAKTFKKMAKNREYGGPMKYTDGGGVLPPTNRLQSMGTYGATSSDARYAAEAANMNPYSPTGSGQGYPMQNIYATGQGQQQAMMAGQTPQQPGYNWGQAAGNLVGAGMAAGSYINSMNNAQSVHQQAQQNGLTGMQGFQNPNGLKGDYSPNTGYFRPQDNTITQPGMYYPTMGQYGGKMQHGGQFWNGKEYQRYDYASQNGNMQYGGTYEENGEYDMDDATIEQLRKQGYQIEMI